MARKSKAPAAMPSVKLKNCPVCGKAFVGTNAMRVCRDCRDKEIEMEQVVMRYVRDHPKCTIKKILDETGVSDSLLKRMIQEGRFTEFAEFRYPCGRCGRMINAGKYCKQCVTRMKAVLQQTHAIMQVNSEREKRTYSDGMTEVADALSQRVTKQK